jgi:hypothetical protein
MTNYGSANGRYRTRYDGPRPNSLSQVYALFGKVDDTAGNLSQLLASGAVVKQIPVDMLVKLDSGGSVLRDEALTEIRALAEGPYLGAAGYDDWWTPALDNLNTPFPLSRARRLAGDKAVLYGLLREHGVAVPRFLVGEASAPWIEEARRTLGPSPVLKPTVGAGSRGVYRYRTDLPVRENLGYYSALRAQDKVHTSVATLAVEYIDALEVSVDFVIIDTAAAQMVVHEKVTAREMHPFVDRVMVAPPVREEITAALPALTSTISSLAAVLPAKDAVIHAELRLRDATWYVLDVGIRPGTGLVGHSFEAITGVDPRLVHLYVSIGLPIPRSIRETKVGRFDAAVISCCYVEDSQRRAVSVERIGRIASELRQREDVIGWHLNTSEIDDALYRPDAGLSIGVGASSPQEALAALRDTISRHSFTTG